MHLNVACTSDELYLPHTATMLHSLRWSNPALPITIHYIGVNALSLASQRKLEHFIAALDMTINWVPIPDHWTQNLLGRDYISKVVWYRIFMPTVLGDLDNVLYIDSDALVVDSLEPLLQVKLNSHYFAAVTNVVPAQFKDRAASLGMPGPEHYFNAGVALWNLELMRTQGFVEQVQDFAHENIEDLLWLEQDALNAMFWSRRLALPPRWNCQNGITDEAWGCKLFSEIELHEARSNPAIVHFEGGRFAKPWHILNRHSMQPRYRFHRRKTPWWPWVPEGLSLRNLAKRLFPELVSRTQFWRRRHQK